MREIMLKAVDFCAYFAYPNGHYGGTVGSRQTLHFYPHGFEILAPEYPMAAAVADRMLAGLRCGALVPPEIQGDRYYQYRVPEFLLSYVDYGQRSTETPPLPYEQVPFEKAFPRGRIFVRKTPKTYLVVNLGKGGVIKQFDLETQKLAQNDCGLLAQLDDGRILTSQWVDPDYKVEMQPPRLSISGTAHRVPTKLFTPVKFIVFRLVMLTLGWNTWLAYQIKGLIRRLLMTRAEKMPLRFERTIELKDESIEVTDRFELEEGVQVRTLLLGDEMPVRYVPQSRYFQPQELDVSGDFLPKEALDRLNASRRLVIRRTLTPGQPQSPLEIIQE